MCCTDSITTIETSDMKEFLQIAASAMDTSCDILTTVAAVKKSTSSLSTGDESGGPKNTIVITGNDDDTDNDKNDDENCHKRAISDIAISNGVSISISDSGSSTCCSSHSVDDTITDSSILYNDLCLSPLSFGSPTTSPQPYHHDHFISDDALYNNHCHGNNNNNNEVQILQLPFL